jgi:hypothetical protein
MVWRAADETSGKIQGVNFCAAADFSFLLTSANLFSLSDVVLSLLSLNRISSFARTASVR